MLPDFKRFNEYIIISRIFKDGEKQNFILTEQVEKDTIPHMFGTPRMRRLNG